MTNRIYKFDYRRYVDSEGTVFYCVEHPDHPLYEFATIRKMDDGRWEIENILTGGAEKFILDGTTFSTRDRAAREALHADQQARDEDYSKELRPIPMTLALLNSLMRHKKDMGTWFSIKDVSHSPCGNYLVEWENYTPKSGRETGSTVIPPDGGAIFEDKEES